MSRIDANRAQYQTWPLEVQEAVLDGRVEKGMTTDQVRTSIGKPSQVTTRAGKKGAEEEVWIYKKGGGGGGLLGSTGVNVGIGGVNVGGGGGGGGGGQMEEQEEVVFQNGVVVSSTHTK